MEVDNTVKKLSKYNLEKFVIVLYMTQNVQNVTAYKLRKLMTKCGTDK